MQMKQELEIFGTTKNITDFDQCHCSEYTEVNVFESNIHTGSQVQNNPLQSDISENSVPDAHDLNDEVACIDLGNQPAQSPVSAFDEEIQPKNKKLNGN